MALVRLEPALPPPRHGFARLSPSPVRLTWRTVSLTDARCDTLTPQRYRLVGPFRPHRGRLSGLLASRSGSLRGPLSLADAPCATLTPQRYRLVAPVPPTPAPIIRTTVRATDLVIVDGSGKPARRRVERNPGITNSSKACARSAHSAGGFLFPMAPGPVPVV